LVQISRYKTGETAAHFQSILRERAPGNRRGKCKIGKRISVASGTDMRVLGTAIHDCLTLSFADRTVPLTETEVERILAGYEVTEFLSSEAVLQQVHAFHSWLEGRWPGAKPNAEIAVQSLLESGQVLNGRIDLLLETTAGWILIDHKSSQLVPEHWDQLATEYGLRLTLMENPLNKRPQESFRELDIPSSCRRSIECGGSLNDAAYQFPSRDPGTGHMNFRAIDAFIRWNLNRGDTTECFCSRVIP